MSLRLVLAVVLAAIAVAASGQSYRLERKVKIGDVARLRMTANIDVAGIPAVFSALLVQKVTALDANNDFTVEVRQTEAAMKYGSENRAIPDGEAKSARYRVNGDLIGSTAEAPNPAEIRSARMNVFVAPGREVKVGDSWSHDHKSMPQSGGTSGRSDYKFEATEKVGDRTAAVISYNYKENSSTNPATAKGKMWIDTETGALLKLETEWIDAPMAGAPAPMNAKVTIVRER